MSILAKLLQKKNDDLDASGQIPPGLLHSVAARSSASKRKSRIMVYVALGSVVSVVAGYFLLMYMEQNKRLTPVLPGIVASPQPSPAPVAEAPPAVSAEKTPADAPAGKNKVARAANKATPPVRVSRSAVTRVAGVNEKRAAAKSFTAKIEAGERTAGAPKTVQQDKATIDAYLFAARNAELRNDYLAALRQYVKAQEADPGNYRIMNNVASTFLRLGLPDEALVFANKALALKGNYVSAMVNAGVCYVKQGNENAAINMFQKAVSYEPANSQALFNLAVSYERNSRFDEAITYYKRLANGRDSRGYLGMARMWEKKGNGEEAVRVYRDLMALPDADEAAKETARKRIGQLEG